MFPIALVKCLINLFISLNVYKIFCRPAAVMKMPCSALICILMVLAKSTILVCRDILYKNTFV